MLANLITQHAAADAAKPDWPAVAAKLNTPSIQRTSGGALTSLGAVLTKIGAVDSETTLAAFDLTQIGSSGRAKLEACGLDFAHPLTVGLIDQLNAAGKLPAGVAAKLKELGTWLVSPALHAGLAPVTADECREAWEAADADKRRAALRERIDAALNQIATAEQSLAVAAFRSIADELEA